MVVLFWKLTRRSMALGLLALRLGSVLDVSVSAPHRSFSKIDPCREGDGVFHPSRWYENRGKPVSLLWKEGGEHQPGFTVPCFVSLPNKQIVQQRNARTVCEEMEWKPSLRYETQDTMLLDTPHAIQRRNTHCAGLPPSVPITFKNAVFLLWSDLLPQHMPQYNDRWLWEWDESLASRLADLINSRAHVCELGRWEEGEKKNVRSRCISVHVHVCACAYTSESEIRTKPSQRAAVEANKFIINSYWEGWGWRVGRLESGIESHVRDAGGDVGGKGRGLKVKMKEFHNQLAWRSDIMVFLLLHSTKRLKVKQNSSLETGVGAGGDRSGLSGCLLMPGSSATAQSHLKPQWHNNG